MADLPVSWLCDLGMEDPMFVDPCDFMASMDEEFFNIPNNSSTTNLSSASISSNTDLAPQIFDELRPSKQYHMAKTFTSPSSGFILSFGNSSNNPSENPQQAPMNLEDEVVSSFLISQQRSSFVNHEEGITKSGRLGMKRKSSGSSSSNPRPRSHAYDHIIAERKRREQLTQLFVALSGIVPGLKKMDKTSVLGEAVKYLKQLQERVKKLEEQSPKEKTMESVVLVKKSQLSFGDDESCSDEKFTGGSNIKPLPEIEARVCNKDVLLRIHCEKHKGVLAKLLLELEKLDLVVVNTSVARFGSLALDITIIAEMETEFQMTVKDLVKRLRPAIQQYFM
ncbi:transcription factor bHLH25-like [Rhododendron vialii]|uniref:transcription factor bHLH25-like n=1 Tax=Rhododendron vialii TaxID=182163 RepID=UPI00265ED8A6|nr:transcription factor bHLH25-like [Rhododendron vialii]XP_058186978.1 transcription factor bHLH25-like [Rhododendron vialii]